MPTLEHIQSQITNLDNISKFGGKKEIKELPNILWEDEVIQKLEEGFYKSGTGILEIQLKSTVMKLEHHLVRVHALHIYRFKAILRWRKKVAIWMH